MNGEQVDYEVVLADLERRKAALEAAIAGIRQLITGGGMSALPSMTGLPPQETPHQLRSDAFFGMSIPEAAKAFLRSQKQPQTTHQIRDALLAGGILSKSKNFHTMLYVLLRREDKAGGDIAHVGKNQWGLREWYGGRKGKRARSSEVERQEMQEGEADEL
jgi:hypothetical protein